MLEAFVDFELRAFGGRARAALDGSFAHYGAIENAHRNRILDVSVAPARVCRRRSPREAVEIARGVLEQLDVVGVLCVEFFLTATGKLLINELAPRPHNSGHLTFDACVTSQFEQQLRAVCGLPLGSTELLRPAAMANLLGDLWRTASRTGRRSADSRRRSCISTESWRPGRDARWGILPRWRERRKRRRRSCERQERRLPPALPCARRQRPSLVHDDRPSQEIPAAAGLDSAIRRFLVADLDEAKTARFAGYPVAHQSDGIDGESGALKKVPHIKIGGLKRKVSNVNPHRIRLLPDCCFQLARVPRGCQNEDRGGF